MMGVANENIKRAEEVVNSIGIPSQPGIVLAIHKEINDPCPDFKKITDLIGHDVSIAAKILKIANSPFFGSRQVSSLEHALSLLGIGNFNNLIITSALRDVLKGCGPSDEVFWNHSMLVARITAYIAKKTGVLPEEEAYLLGLFHDCAIPLLLKKFPDYVQVFDSAIDYRPESIYNEEKLVKTNHSIVGYIVAKSWRLPEVMCEAIQFHHADSAVRQGDPSVSKARAALLLSEYICHCYTAEISGIPENDDEWLNHYGDVICELDIDVDDIKDFKEDSIDMLSRMEYTCV